MLYQVKSPADKAIAGLGQSAQTYGAMQQKPFDPPKTAGGMISAGMGGAGMGAAIASGMTGGAAVGPPGVIAGAGAGMLAYYLS